MHATIFSIPQLGVINRFISFYLPFSPHIYRQSSVGFKQRCLDNSRGDEVGNLYSLHLTWQRYRAMFKVLPCTLYVSAPSEILHFWSFIFILLLLVVGVRGKSQTNKQLNRILSLIAFTVTKVLICTIFSNAWLLEYVIGKCNLDFKNDKYFTFSLV